MAASMVDASNVAMGCRQAMAAASLVLGVGCGGAGAYSHAPSYAPIDDEATIVAGAREYDASAARSQGPEGWKKAVSLFGVVESRAAGPGGQALLKLSVRALEPQNVVRPARGGRFLSRCRERQGPRLALGARAPPWRRRCRPHRGGSAVARSYRRNRRAGRFANRRCACGSRLLVSALSPDAIRE